MSERKFKIVFNFKIEWSYSDLWKNKEGEKIVCAETAQLEIIVPTAKILIAREFFGVPARVEIKKIAYIDLKINPV